MKTLLILSVLFSAGSAFASNDFPNDTMTEVWSKGSDCGVINVDDAYFTQYGNQGRSGLGLVFHVIVRNDAYVKKIQILNLAETAARTVAFSSETGSSDLSGNYTYSDQGYDHFTVVDKLVGTSPYGVYDLSVTMNGHTFTCSKVMIRIKEE
jgi:hypothetical protein